jgi:magnesium-transporting ATPase (P-type)
MEQDKAGKFLDEMRPKLLALESPHSAQIFSDTTSKFYPIRTSTEGSVFELSIKVPYSDLECTEKRFLNEKNIDFSMDRESMSVCVRKNGFGRKVESPEYWRVKKAIERSCEKFEKERLSGKRKPDWYRKRQGLL